MIKDNNNDNNKEGKGERERHTSTRVFLMKIDMRKVSWMRLRMLTLINWFNLFKNIIFNGSKKILNNIKKKKKKSEKIGALVCGDYFGVGTHFYESQSSNVMHTHS